GAWFARPDGGAVPGTGKDEVVRVLRLASELGRPLAARGEPRLDASRRGRPGQDDEGLGRGPPRQRAGHPCPSIAESYQRRPMIGQPLRLRPRRRACPGSAPVWRPASTTSSPLTTTYSIPSGKRRGSSYV